jgi:hypothetical protein
MNVSEYILGGIALCLFGALWKLREEVSEMKVGMRDLQTMKEFWMRTAERRDNLLRAAQQWRAYALKVGGVPPSDSFLPEEEHKKEKT